MDRFLLHSLVLLWASVEIARRLAPDRGDRLLAAALLAWGNLIVTHLVFAAFHRPDEPAWFFGLSVALLLATALGARWIPAPADEPVASTGGKTNPWLRGLFLATIGPLAVGGVVAAYFYAPDHYGAASFGLSRLNLGLPPVLPPCNYPFVECFGLTRGLALPRLDFPGLAAWAITGLAVHRLARLEAFSANASLLAAWIVLLTPTLLAQAAIPALPALPAGAALLTAFVFAKRGAPARRPTDAALAGLAAVLALSSLAVNFIREQPASAAAPPESAPAGEPPLLAADLLRPLASPFTVSEGLLPTEGPFPPYALPPLRLAKEPVIKIQIPPTPGLKRLTLTFSARLQARLRAGLEVRFNGAIIQQYLLPSPTAWLDRSVELDAQPGENVLELRDISLPTEPNWLEYLERYPDVNNAVIAQNESPEAGARKHYTLAGQAEGRTVRLRPLSPAPSVYFLFRTLRVEGFE